MALRSSCNERGEVVFDNPVGCIKAGIMPMIVAGVGLLGFLAVYVGADKTLSFASNLKELLELKGDLLLLAWGVHYLACTIRRRIMVAVARLESEDSFAARRNGRLFPSGEGKNGSALQVDRKN